MKWVFDLCMMYMQGRFQILSLSGKYTFVPGQEGKYGEHNSWNLAISDFNGAVFGGSVVGPIIVASPVEVRSFLLCFSFGGSDTTSLTHISIIMVNSIVY